MNYAFPMPICDDIWNLKYRLKDPESGEPIDLTVEDTWSRTANALAEVETNKQLWQGNFYSALEDWTYMPAGRIVAGAGTERNVTLFNCYVMGTVPDDLEGIFEALKEAALTMQQGGGIGYDFSTLRPKGSLVKRVGAKASGPMPFMDTWDAMCRTIMSAGTRRGAMMATMRCDHPDILDFVTAKQDAARLRMFNVSVLCTDAFMDAVKNDKPWDLVFGGKVYETVSALELWRTIMRSTYDYAEPGVIFIDRINEDNNLRYCETIAATNPCGEQPLPPYGACLLGSANLAKLVLDPFTTKARIDSDKLEKTVATAIRMMDNVNDVSKFPLEAQRVEAQNKRRIGLGVTGLADMLAMLRIPYGSKESLGVVNAVMSDIAHEAYKTSIALAAEKGAFPLFDYEAFVEDGTFASRMAQDPEIDEGLQNHGIRNALLLSIAPTGTISMYGGNVSSGIEPIFAFEYERKVTRPDGTKTTEEVKDYAVWLYQEMFPGEPLPDYFVSAQDLPPSAHLDMQAVCQRWIDSSISKTINLPKDIAFADFEQVYLDAYDKGCKGCTTYRPNDVTGSVLSVKEEKPAEIATPTPLVALLDRPESVVGRTYKLKFPGDDHAIYMTVNDVEIDGRLVPFELFLNSKNMAHYAWAVALTRMISAVFRRGGDVGFVVEELRSVFDPKGGGWVKGKYQPSLLALIGATLGEHMKSTGYLERAETVSEAPAPVTEVQIVGSPTLCPSCSGSNYKHEGGCTSCGDCGHSSCG
tara:strand:+ start:2752 stop:5010 length:2259 start_codon:yes stop_codon:yes gene_type:complete